MLRTGSRGSVLSAFTLMLRLFSPSKDVCVEDVCRSSEGDELDFKRCLFRVSEAEEHRSLQQLELLLHDLWKAGLHIHGLQPGCKLSVKENP